MGGKVGGIASDMIRQQSHHIAIATRGRGFYEFTREAARLVSDANMRGGLAAFFIQHTSASLLIQENADPEVRRDLERFLSRLVPDGDPLFQHVAEGDDDMTIGTASTQVKPGNQWDVQIPRDGVIAVGAVGRWTDNTLTDRNAVDADIEKTTNDRPKDKKNNRPKMKGHPSPRFRIKHGVTAIELCAGFGVQGTARISKAVEGKALVGVVRFDLHPAFNNQSGDKLF